MTDKFKELFGIIKSERSVSLEEMEQAIAQCAVERFNNAVESFNTGSQEIQNDEYEPIDTLWDGKD